MVTMISKRPENIIEMSAKERRCSYILTSWLQVRC